MNNIKLLITALCVLSISACSTQGRIGELVVSPDELDIKNRYNIDVSIEVIGGDRRFVSSDSFKAALLNSLEKSNVFSSVNDNDNARYELFVILLRSENSGMGGSYLIHSKWIFRDNGKEIWTEKIIGNGSSYAFAGVARIRASAERASKDTIQNGIEMLGKLPL